MVEQHVGVNLNRVDKIVMGRIVDIGPDHLTLHDVSENEDITFRTDDTTHYAWSEGRSRGRLTDSAQVRVGYFIAGGLLKAAEVLVLDPGNGTSVAERVVPVH